MKDGAIVCNTGNVNVEIDLDTLYKIKKKKHLNRKLVEEFTMPDGRKINILGEGQLINLASVEGHPSSVMGMSFANQALSAAYLL
jgi:adenosylhomocysteinase